MARKIERPLDNPRCLACGSSEGSPVDPKEIPLHERMRSMDQVKDNWFWKNLPEPYTYKVGPFCSEKCARSDLPLSIVLKLIFGDENKGNFLLWLMEHRRVEQIGDQVAEFDFEFVDSPILVPAPQLETGKDEPLHSVADKRLVFRDINKNSVPQD